jgi:TRAP-type transport system small permease protein
MVSVGAIVAAADRQHLALDLLTSRLGATAQRFLAAAANLVVAAVLCVLIWGSWQQVVVGWSSYSPVMKYPQALLAGATLVMSFVMLVTLIAQQFSASTGKPAAAAGE